MYSSFYLQWSSFFIFWKFGVQSIFLFIYQKVQIVHLSISCHLLFCGAASTSITTSWQYPKHVTKNINPFSLITNVIDLTTLKKLWKYIMFFQILWKNMYSNLIIFEIFPSHLCKHYTIYSEILILKLNFGFFHLFH